MKPFLPGLHATALGCCAILLASCANPGITRVEKFQAPLQKGDYGTSLALVQKNADLYGDNTRFLYEMDQGVLFHYLGEWDSSTVHLQQAEQILEDLYAKSVTNEAASLLTNDNLRPYRSRPYETVLLSQFLLTNYLAKGDVDGALVEARKGTLLLDKLAENDKHYHDEGMLHYLHAIAYAAAGEEDNSSISLYKAVNAYANGDIPVPAQVREAAWWNFKHTDRESDIQSLKLSPPADSAFLKALDTSASEIIVLCYGGRIPVIDQLRFWGSYLPDGGLAYYYNDPETGKEMSAAIAVLGVPGQKMTGETMHINFTMPVLKSVPSTVQGFRVVADGATQRSAELTDTQVLLRRNLDDEHTTTLIRTAIRVVLRTYAAQKGKNATQTGNPFVDLLKNIGVDALQGGIEQSDVRLCIWLPREVSIVRIPVAPGTHDVRVQLIGTNGSVVGDRSFDNVKVPKGRKRFLVAAATY